MERNRAYRRSERNRAIARKKGAVKRFSGGRFTWYTIDGKYAKGKIHCSCAMCREKDFYGRHVLTKAEIIAIDKVNEAKKKYEGTSFSQWMAS